MVPRPTPTPLIHFTHISHLGTILKHGLLSDTEAQRAGLILAEVGNQGIKSKRRCRRVPVPPGGAVADYTPFYFAARSPMMSAIKHGRVPAYAGSCDDLIHLVTTVERLVELGIPLVFTDRNAVLDLAEFTADLRRLDTLVDWPLMRAHIWTNTDAQPDRRERRMAECLAYRRAPWTAFTEVVTKTRACAGQAQGLLDTVGESVRVVVRPGWYF
jgi:hypothetical protein